MKVVQRGDKRKKPRRGRRITSRGSEQVICVLVTVSAFLTVLADILESADRIMMRP